MKQRRKNDKVEKKVKETRLKKINKNTRKQDKEVK